MEMHLLDENASRERAFRGAPAQPMAGEARAITWRTGWAGHSVGTVCEGCKTLVMPFAGHIIQGMEADGRVGRGGGGIGGLPTCCWGRPREGSSVVRETAPLIHVCGLSCVPGGEGPMKRERKGPT